MHLFWLTDLDVCSVIEFDPLGIHYEIPTWWFYLSIAFPPKYLEWWELWGRDTWPTVVMVANWNSKVKPGPSFSHLGHLSGALRQKSCRWPHNRLPLIGHNVVITWDLHIHKQGRGYPKPTNTLPVLVSPTTGLKPISVRCKISSSCEDLRCSECVVSMATEVDTARHKVTLPSLTGSAKNTAARCLLLCHTIKKNPKCTVVVETSATKQSAVKCQEAFVILYG